MKILIQGPTGANPPRGVKGRTRALLKGALGALGLKGAELSVVLTDDEGIRELNRTYLGKDRPTDVLSFPQEDPELLGDIVVSLERTGEQAERYGVGFDEELARLLVHGLLHLLGYDHVHGGTQAARMKAKEAELLGLILKEDKPVGRA